MLKFLAVAAMPLWACQTSSGIPCFTLTYEHSVWALVASPVRDLVTAEVKGTMAVREDGSFLHQMLPASRFAVRDRKDAGSVSTRLYLADSKQLILHGTPASTDFRNAALFFLDGPYRRSAGGGDGCRAVVASFGGSPEKAGDSKMLGEPVVNWKLTSKFGVSTAVVAPGLDCQVLRLELTEYRYRYVPVRKELFEAKTLRRGEPDASLFARPKGK